MILAAGLGTRMRPLTDHTPKPLLKAGGKSLIEYHIENLRRAGITELVINLAHLGAQIRAALGDGSRFGVSIAYSDEGADEGRPLETGGAILKALPLLGREPFLLINGDIWTDFNIGELADVTLASGTLGHLLLVENPPHNPAGDFGLTQGRLTLKKSAEPAYTFSGISLLNPALVEDYPQRRAEFPLGECLRYAIGRGQLAGQLHCGQWWDIGTPERLAELDRRLS